VIPRSRRLRVQSSLQATRLNPGEYDDLDRLTAVDGARPLSHRRRAVLGLVVLISVVGLVATVCARPPHVSTEHENSVPFIGR
jgi:hypothetical protein